MKKIPENTIVIIKAVTPLILIVMLFVFLLRLGITKVGQIRNQLSGAKEENGILTQKLEMLKTVALTGDRDSNVTVNALTDTNPSLLVLSQLKNLAVNNGLILNNVKANSSKTESSDMNNVLVSFNLIGPKGGMLTFFDKVGTFAPISVLDSVKLTEAGGTYNAEVTVKSFWSPMPEKLPATIEEFQDLTAEDKETLVNISGLAQPQFATLPEPNGEGKADPFSL